jgi:rod shape-determining protein MreC
MANQHEPFFNRGPSPLARLTFFALLAIVVMIADHRFRALDTVRLAVSVVLYPLEQLVAAPGAIAGRVASYFSSQDRLLRENRELQLKVLDLSALSQQSQLLKTEHEHLTRLAKSRSRFEDRGITAEVIRDARNPFNRRILIDKGLAHGLRAGVAVIDGSGVVGQVTAVGTFSSEVTLITDKDQSVPVMVVRNGQRAVTVGTGKEGTIDVPFIPVNSDIQNGDLFVTSGIDGTYPPGLAVAIVTSVEKNAAFMFARISGKPASAADNFRYVLVLLSPQAEPYPKPDVASDEKQGARDKPAVRPGAPRK